MALPAPHEVIRRPDMSFEEIVAALVAAGYVPFEAHRLAAFATGRTRGDVVREKTAGRRVKPQRALAPV